MTSGGRFTLVVLAAGASSRYRGLKQLDPVGPSGEALFEYAAFDALRSGFGSVVLVVRKETEGDFRRRLDGGLARCATVRYAHQRVDDLPTGFAVPVGREKPWGTGHAVLAASGHVDGPFAVINADDFYGRQSYAAIGNLLAARGGSDRCAAVVGFPVGKTLSAAGPVSRAILETDGSGELGEILELPEVWEVAGRLRARDVHGTERALDGDELVSMNMWGFPQAVLPALGRGFALFVDRSPECREGEFILPEAVGDLVREDALTVEVLATEEEWFGMTFREDLGRVRKGIFELVAKGAYPPNLWSGS